MVTFSPKKYIKVTEVLYYSSMTTHNSFLPAYSQWTAMCLAPPSGDPLGRLVPQQRKEETKIDTVQLFSTLSTVEMQKIAYRTQPNCIAQWKRGICAEREVNCTYSGPHNQEVNPEDRKLFQHMRRAGISNCSHWGTDVTEVEGSWT